MKKLWEKTGNALFWGGWPLLWLYLYKSHRTRVLLTCGNKILVTKSWLGNGKWTLPGGGLHDGEQPIDGALRELEEETGISLQAHQLKLQLTDQCNVNGLSFFYDLFAGSVTKMPDMKRQRLEIVDAQWMHRRKLNRNNANADVLTARRQWFNHH